MWCMLNTFHVSSRITWTQDIFFLVDAVWKHHKYPCFYILPLDLGSTLTCINMKTVRFYVKIALNLQRICLGTPDCKYTDNMVIDFNWLNMQAKSPTQPVLYQFNEIWLCESDPNAPSICGERGGKQWQHSIRVWAYCGQHQWVIPSRPSQ